MSPATFEKGALTVYFGDKSGKYPDGNQVVVRGRDTQVAFDTPLVANQLREVLAQCIIISFEQDPLIHTRTASSLPIGWVLPKWSEPTRAAAERLRRDHWLGIWMAGTLMAVPLSIPLVNLIMPLVGVATYTHTFHRLWARQPAP